MLDVTAVSAPPRRLRISGRHLWSTSLAVLVLGCSDGPAGPGGNDGTVRGDVAAGRAAFVESCSGCHASRDGFDLAHFGYPDTTIVRRALTHVTERTARDIAAHIRSLGPARATREARVFQPGGRLLAGDRDFAIDLFGADEWPADLTAEALASIDPREVAVAIPFPRWSEEQEDIDWLSDRPLSDALLDWDPGSPVLGPARGYLEAYYDERDAELAGRVIQALREAVSSPPNPSAPCSGGERTIVPDEDPRACFDALRWIASFAGQHVLREGAGMELPQAFHQAWWDVGASLGNVDSAATDIGGMALNRAAWTYLAWTFAPADERSGITYSTDELVAIGLPRHAVFNSLRAMVARPPRSMVAWADLSAAARHAPPHWSYRVVKFGYEHLLARLEAGDWPIDLLYPKGNVQAAYSHASRSVSGAELAELQRLRDEVIELLLSPLQS